MAKQTINIGLHANDRKGDPLRVSFSKINDNFTELYDHTLATDLTFVDSSILSSSDIRISSANNVWDFKSTGQFSLASSTPWSSDILGTLNTYPMLIAYGEAHGGPEFDWVNTSDLNMFNDQSVMRNAMYFNGEGLYIGINENGVQGEFTGNWQFDTVGNMYFPDSTIQSTAYPGGEDNRVWVSKHVTGSESNNPASYSFTASSVTHDWNGNIISCIINSDSLKDQTAIVKYSPEGVILWQKTLGTDFSLDGWSVATDGYNSVYVVGTTGSSGNDGFILKLDLQTGDLVWQKILSNSGAAAGYVVDVDNDRNPILVGWASNTVDGYTSRDQLIMKLSAVNGNVIWQKTIGNAIYDDQAFGMAVDRVNNKIIAIGYNSGTGGVAELTANAVSDPTPYVGLSTVFEFNNIGPEFGNKDINVSISFNNGVPVPVITAGGYYHNTSEVITIPGTSFGFSSPENDVVLNVTRIRLDTMLISCFNNSGDLQWKKTVIQDPNYDSSGVDAAVDIKGNIYALGQYRVNNGNNVAVTLMKMNSDGAIQWSKKLQGDCDQISSSVTVDINNVYVTGTAINYATQTFSQFVSSYNLDGNLNKNRKFLKVNNINFTSGFFTNINSGSAISVFENYIAICGSSYDTLSHLTNNGNFNSYVAQLPKHGNKTYIGPYVFTDSNLVSYSTNFVSIDADSNSADSSVVVNDSEFIIDQSIFVSSVLYDHSSSNTGDLTFNSNAIIGSGTGSGDGNGFSTLELVPDRNRYLSNDQYIIIDPTAPNHIHLRAGGQQDNSNANLILGGENTNVQVSDSSKNVIISANNQNWYLNQNGSISFPSLTTGRAGTGETLKFGQENAQSIITGPDTSSTYPTSQRLVIQGTSGYTGTTGEGGDIYLWAGNGGDGGGTGGDIKIDGGVGALTGEGGTIKIRGGYSTGGTGGFVEIRSGDSGTGAGGPIDIWAGTGNSGGGSITFHLNSPINGYQTVTISSDGSLTSTSKISDKIGDIRIVPQNIQSAEADYELTLLDSGKHVYKNDGLGFSVLIPTDATINFDIGTFITIVSGDGLTFINASDPMTTAVWGAGFNQTSSAWYIPSNSTANLLKIGPDKWMLSGFGLATN